MVSINPTTYATPLQEGEEVITIAASSIVSDENSLRNGLEIFAKWGLLCRENNVIGRNWGYLAGDDTIRFNELHPDHSANLKVFARGGWGAARLLERRQPWQKGWLLGFSDVSSILLSRLASGFDGNIHGPLITSLPKEPEWSKERLRSILFGESIPDLHGVSWHNGIARGPLVACNLTVASHLLGSSHMPSLKGAILVLEDIGEEPYRIDRMLTQWRLSGLLQGLAGLAFGDFVKCENQFSNEETYGFEVNEILKERSKDLQIPVIADLPVGHSSANAALPLGREALIDGNKGLLRVFSS
ncbi:MULTISPECIES: S66 peptidase family protein [Prochlorococcus]|uniref:S66 peptidase family protein n=1 Tax=Prochlorococcus TaxID=1218 RepID=UPI0005338DCD|nr:MULTISPECIES: LD-carboxypeptidase [Prochlorococcus]KGG12938.1 Muramoyltetrapeptide carboxypeptidase [Prochlorococcus sp. MIT 0601]